MLLRHGLSGIAYKAAAAGGLTKTYIDESAPAFVDANPLTLDFTGISEGDQVYIGIVLTQGSAAANLASTTLDLEGGSLTKVGNTSESVSRSKCYFYKGTVNATAANNATADINFTGSPPIKSGVAFAWKVVGTVSTETIASNEGTDVTAGPFSADVNTVTGGVCLGIIGNEDDTSDLVDPTVTWSGLTKVGTDVEDSVGNAHSRADADISSGETPRSISFTRNASSRHWAVLTLALS